MACACLIEGDPLEEARALMDCGCAAEAAAVLRERLAAGRGGALARITLVEALLQAGDGPGALAEAREASSLHPNIGVTLMWFGVALMAEGQLPAAIAELQRALRLDPESREARQFLARAWLNAGEADKALEALQYADNDDLRAEAEAIKAAPRSDPRYVRHLFDQFSADYDRRMRENLSYAAPEMLRDLFGLVLPGREGLSILDLGCGTGLAGELFRPLARRMEGVDLSPAMIGKARERNIYDHLAVADIETLLALDGPAYDLILAADTLVYLGDLAPVFSGAAARLAPEGCFLFTVERAEGDGYELGPKRRWRHGETYLRDLAQQAGFAVAGLVAAAPRREAGVPVDGFAVALVR